MENIKPPPMILGAPRLAFGSLLACPMAILAALAIDQIDGCSAWIGCLVEALVAAAAILVVGIILGVASAVRRDPRPYLAIAGIVANALPLGLVIAFFWK